MAATNQKPDNADTKTNLTEPELTATPASVPKKSFLRSKKSKLLSLILAGAVVLLGASAAGYYGVVVPNKPENVLKTAVEKQLQKRQTSSKGSLSLDFKKEETGLKNITVTYKGVSDLDKQAFSTELEAAASGAKLPLEIRSVDKNMYFKVGDLGSVKGLASTVGGPAAGAVIDGISSKLSNQWFEIDQSLLKQAKAECVTNIFSGFSQKDIDNIMSIYASDSFMSVKNKSSDNVGGKTATKYDLGLDKSKAEQFSQKLGNLEAFKNIRDCVGTAAEQTGIDKDVSGEVTDADISMAVWVDSGKNLRQIEVKGSDDETALTATITFTDDKVDIQKPNGAKPLMEVLGDFSSLFGGIGSTATTPSSTTTNDPLEGMSASCKAAYQNYITSGGTSQLPMDCL